MNKYILLIALTSFFFVQAESNPFDLEENLKKIDQDQDILLNALKEMALKKEKLDDIENVVPVIEEERLTEIQINEHKEIEENNKENVLPMIPEEVKEDKKVMNLEPKNIQVLDKEVSNDNFLIEAEEANKKRALAAKKREIERLEVEAYEEKRIEKERIARELIAKLEKEKKEELLKLDQNKVVDIDLDKERLEKAKDTEDEYLKAIREVDM